MRVLVLSDNYPPNTKGGADIAAQRLSTELAARGHQMRVLTTVDDPARVGTGEVSGVEVERIYSNYPIRFRSFVAAHNPGVSHRVAAQVAGFRPDIVHAHNIHTHISFESLVAARKAGAPVVLTAHDHQLFCAGKFDCLPPDGPSTVTAGQCARCQRFRYSPLRDTLIRRAMRRAGARIMAVSSALRDDLIANRWDPSIIDVVHNGIDPASMVASQEHVDTFARRHSLEGKKVILFGGRVSHAKGIDQAVEALAKLPRDLNFTFLVLGSSEDYISYILQQGRRLSVEDKTLFLPWLSGEDLKAAYAVSDVCLTPSIYREPFNLINIEAMMMGKPVITTCFGGPPEVVEDGVSGYVLDPRNTDLFSERLLELLSDGERARSMGEAGHTAVMERFTVTRQAERTEETYRKVLGTAA